MPTPTVDRTDTVNELVINKMTQAEYDALANKSNTELYLVPDTYDTSPTINSGNPITSGGVFTALADKQNTLSTQTAYSAKGSATKVPQITTNTLGQVTSITEVTITQPDISGKEDKITIVGNTSNSSFTADVGKYYVVSGNVSNLTITLPTIDVNNNHVQNFIFYFESGSTAPTIGFTDTVSPARVVYPDGFTTFDASSKYEVNCLWNGANWLIAAIKFS